MKCIQCGQEIADGAAFCPLCGGKQTPQPQMQQAQPVQQPQQNVYQQPQQNFYQQANMGYAQQMQPRQPGAADALGKDLGDLFKNLFSNPVKIMKELTKKSSWIMAVIFIAVQSIFTALMFIAVNKGVYSFGNLISNGKAFGLGILTAIGINGFFALFIWLFMGVVAKKEVSFLQALTVVGFKSLGNAPFLLLGFLLGLANVWIGIVIGLAGMVLGYVYMLSAVADRKDEGCGYLYQRFAAIACTVVASAIWFWLMAKIF